MKKWWIYQRERFPIFAHGPLVAAFSFCAVSFSSLLVGDTIPSGRVYLVAFAVCLLMFLQLRIADEFKDYEEDARWRPYRPVQRGLVSLAELRVVFIFAAVIQLLLTLWLSAPLVLILLLAWMYLALMSVEFFCRSWLKKRPLVYLVTHMGIMPLVDFYGTACEWMPLGISMPQGLGWFLAASFFNGIVIELGRKLRQPKDEEEGVETYSFLWGKRGGALAWLSMMVLTVLCAGLAARQIDFVVPVLVTLCVVSVLAAALAWRYVGKTLPGKYMEMASGLWTLVLYLSLGIVPLLWRNLF